MITGRYGHAGEHFASGSFIWATHTFKVVLLDSGYALDTDAHQFYSNVSADELATANGYTVGGQTLAGKSLSYIAADDQTALLASNTVWTAVGTLAGRWAVVYRDTGTPTTSPLLCWANFEADVSATDDDLTIDWNDTGGVVKL